MKIAHQRASARSLRRHTTSRAQRWRVSSLRAGSALFTLSMAATGTISAAHAAEGSYGSSEAALRGAAGLGSGQAISSSVPNSDPGNFYASLPEFVSAKPGEILKKERTNFALGIPKVDWTGSKATRVAYASTDPNGKTIPVTGTVYQSSKPWRGKGQRPLMIVAPGTQGTSDSCAPGKLMPWGLEYEGIPVAQGLMRGWDVAITDLPGLGTKSPHTYMNRVSQANATLDMGRAAKNLALRGVNNDTPIATWGYSQGGGASAAALELHDKYAPDLNIVAGFAGGVPANLAVVAQSIDNSMLAAALGYTINGLLYTKPDLAPLVKEKLNAKGQKLLEMTKDECVPESLLRHAYVDTRTLTKTGESLTDMLAQEPLKSVVKEQLIGGMPPKIPVYIGQGTHDDTIPATQARALARAWSEGGTPVYYQEHDIPKLLPLADHAIPMMTHLMPAIEWLEKVVDGQKYPVSSLPDIPQPKDTSPRSGSQSGVTLSQ